MATFDGNGLVIDRLADIKTDIQDDLKEAFGDGINLNETAPWGVIIGIISEKYYLLWEKLEAVYLASFVDTSYGNYLDELVALNGMTREPASYSTVVLEFTRDNGIDDGDVTIPAGTQASVPDSSTLWTTLADATILDGTMTITASASPTDTGPFAAVQDTITSLVSTPANVASVNNPAAAEIGTIEESDAALKIRRWTELGRSGTATESGIRSALQALDNVATATVILNDTDNTVDGRPPHSVSCYVDVVSGAITDPAIATELAQTIWNAKGAGIQTNGDESGTAEDTNGDDQTVYFSDITTQNVWVKVYLTITDDYDSASDDAIALALQTWGELNLTAGTDVLNYKIEGAATNVGATGITALRTEMSTDGAAFSDSNISIGPDGVAYIPEGTVTFVKTGP